jgi:hypothetical protein
VGGGAALGTVRDPTTSVPVAEGVAADPDPAHAAASAAVSTVTSGTTKARTMGS